MKHTTKLLVATLCGLSTISLPAQEAQARGGSPSVGHPQYKSDTDCFRISGSGVQNTCASHRSWVAETIVDWNRNTMMRATFQNTSNTGYDVTCTARAYGPNGNTYRFKTKKTYVPSRLLRDIDIWLHTVAYGSLSVGCRIPKNDIKFTNFHYWQPED